MTLNLTAALFTSGRCLTFPQSCLLTWKMGMRTLALWEE